MVDMLTLFGGFKSGLCAFNPLENEMDEKENAQGVRNNYEAIKKL